MTMLWPAPRSRFAPLLAALLCVACRENLVRPAPGPREAPVLVHVSPTEVPQFAAGAVLNVVGARFSEGSVVRWDGHDLPTTFVTDSLLRAEVSAAALEIPGSADITVFTPPPGGGTSSIALVIVAERPPQPEDAPVPAISRLLPSAALEGRQSLRLTIYGTGFTPRSVVRFNGADRPTAYIKDSRIVVMLSAADLNDAGSVDLTVFTSRPGGGTSPSQPFAVLDASPGHPWGWDVTSVPIADAPWFVAVSPQGVGFVARPSTDSILQVDLATGANLGSVAAGHEPAEVAFDAAGGMWVASTADSSLVAITTTGTARFPLPDAPRRLMAVAGGHRLAVTTAGGALLLVDRTSGAVVGTTTLATPGDALAGSADGQRLWAGGADGSLAAVAAASGAITGTLTLDGPVRDIAVAPDGGRLYVTVADVGVIVVDAATLAIAETIRLDDVFGAAVTPDGSQLWLTQPELGLVVVFDLRRWEVAGQVFTSGRPRHIRFSPNGAAAFLANEAGSVLIVR